MNLVGREAEKEILERLLSNDCSEFLAIYGRRRIGKTFLIDKVCHSKLVFAMSGLHHASLKDQLINFTQAFEDYSHKQIPYPKNWLEAFQVLKKQIDAKKSPSKKVIFIDELPWLCTARSGFLSAIEHFWNSWASKRTDILLIVCGSSASWMIRNIIHNKGGLHNRITQSIKLMPFTLRETELLLKRNNIKFNRYQIIQLYMITGGVPYYLMAVQPGMSIDQVVNQLCFSQNGLLKNEFSYVFQSLFENANAHISILETLSKKNRGMTRMEILGATGLPNAGSTTRLLEELEESGFIIKTLPYQNIVKDAIYRLVDNYTLFYLEFIQNRKYSSNMYLTISKLPQWNTWQGFAFENICMQHIAQIKNKLGISGVNTRHASWLHRGTKAETGTQIDLLIDRDDMIINICEIKFSSKEYEITKSYADIIQRKLEVFEEKTKTNKSSFFTMITSRGIKRNEYYYEFVQNHVDIEDLFA